MTTKPARYLGYSGALTPQQSRNILAVIQSYR